MSRQLDQDSSRIIGRVEEVLAHVYDANSAFNDALDAETELVEVPSVIPDRDPYAFPPSQVLFWLDRTAYDDEFEHWTGASVHREHYEALEHLNTSGQKTVFQHLVGAMQRRRLAPFVGAGLSLPSGFPLWGNALRRLAERIGVSDAVEQSITDGDYLSVAEQLWQANDVLVRNYIRTAFAEAKSAEAIKGPIHLLADLSSGCIVTTNFDSLIEDVVDHVEGYMHGTQAGHKFVPMLISGRRCILKLHGDAEDHDTYVFTEAQYADAYCIAGDPGRLDFTKPLPRALRQIYISHSLLFLGCSLEQDRTLTLFEQVASTGQFDIPDHFAILPEPADGEEKAAKESRLLRLSIRPIWYPEGDHDFVEAYLRLALDMANGVITSLDQV